MPFAVEDFHDLIRLLGERPDWQAELRRHVLSEELLGLPAQLARLAVRWEERFAALAEAQARTDARLAALVEAQARTEERLERLEAAVERLAEAQARTEERLERLEAAVERLAEAQARTEARLAALMEAQARTEAWLERLEGAQSRAEARLGRLEGDLLELRYDRRAPAYFSRLAKRLQVVDSGSLADLLDEAVVAGRLGQAERDTVLLADLVLSGQRRDDGEEIYLLAEISAGIGPGDVERAVHRAALLARLGRPVLAVVAGRSITRKAASMAKDRGVWQVLDGRPAAPSSEG